VSKVFVLDTNKKPLQPCHPAKARQLLHNGKAAVFRRYPFTIILKCEVTDVAPSSLRLKIDPGSRTTGLAVVDDEDGEVVFGAELHHRYQQIRGALLSRRQLRRARRTRKTRYRKPRFSNRRRPEGWLPPSLESRVDNIETWVRRICRYAPIAAISMELVKFDTQKLQNPEISGVEYQQGELVGYEVREYLLEKWGRKCSYCGAENVPLQIEHIVPKTRGGSNRVSNLALSCEPCNLAKGTKTATEFGYPDIAASAKQPLHDAAAVNSTRWTLFKRLKQTGLDVETGTGGQTKYNRTQRNLPKEHWIDAACVGESTPEQLVIGGVVPLRAIAKGHGRRQRCGTDKYGFPIRHAPRAKSFMGFQTGDTVMADIPRGRHAGVHTGRIAIRFRPSFRLSGFDVHPKYLTILHRSDGYEYEADSSHD
jgi:5-methylcytosine-specific restriction endonuclease McrA